MNTHKSPPSLLQALFLGTRERSPNTAILLTSAADGYVYAWSIHHLGGLLGKFRAVHSEGTAISTMSTDLQDQMLLTGDSTGYIMVGRKNHRGLVVQTFPYQNVTIYENMVV